MIEEREPADFPFPTSDVAQLHRLCGNAAAAVIDDTTWKDLMLDQFHAELSREVSIFGQHELYRRLREGKGRADANSVERLTGEPTQLDELHRICKSLRHAEVEIATLLYHDETPPIPWWAGKTWLLAPALLVSLLCVAVSPASLIAGACVLYVLMAGQMRYHERIEKWQRKMNSLQMLLRVVTLLDGDDALAASKMNRRLSPSSVSQLVPGARGYGDWFMLSNVSHYYKAVALVAANLAFLRGCFGRITNLEADIAVARHLLQAPRFCRADMSGAAVDLSGVVHPLLPGAQPLTFFLKQKGAFISGQNGIGKSTLLRTVGLNLIAARAFGFCYAARATVPDLPVYASMQGEDSLLAGESLYMAELRRAKELLTAADGPHPGIYVIDEIFRGTNHLESVSAAAAVLNALTSKGPVIVSSHNLVLGALLEHRLNPLCVHKGGDGGLILSPGVLPHTNGIALLSEIDFGIAIENNAGKVFDWLSAYLTHPPGSGEVLA